MSSSSGQDRSLSELERDAERTRAELMHTVEALHHRVSPQVLKAEAKEYVRHTGEDFLGAVQQRARENPLQAVAIAAGLTFPLWRIAASMPVPLLLIGAGLALGRSSGHRAQPGQSDSHGAQLYQQAREKAEQAVGTVRERVHDAAEAVQQKASGVAEQVSHAAEHVTAGLRSVQERASETLGKAASTASQMAAQAASIPSQVYGSGTEAAQSGMQTARDSASHMADQVKHTAYRGAVQMRDTGRNVQHDLINTIQQHPLLVGAIGLAAGAVVAAAFPSTRVENRMFGQTSEALKEQAQDLVTEGAELARTTVTDLYQQALEEARAQGLSPEALRDAVKELASKAKTVAQNATGLTASQPALADASSTH
jgi:ElaB/YqjD/DUF883 family membrane-anchored ribosome-binding protein